MIKSNHCSLFYCNMFYFKELHLKIGVPVMLLKNLRSDLVNGLTGTVAAMGDESVDVSFPDFANLVTIPRHIFTW